MSKPFHRLFPTPRTLDIKELGSRSESDLVFTFFAFTFAFGGVETDFFVVLLEGGEIFTGFREFTFFHTFTDVPVDEGTLGVHEVKLVVKSGPCLGNGSGVRKHADGTLNLGQVTAWDDGWRLVVDADLEAGWAPVDELDGSLGLDGGNGCVDILWHDVATVKHAARHVLAVTWVALDHLVGWLEAHVGDLGNRELLVVGLLGRDDWSIGGQREVDTWVWHEVGLELGEVNVEGTVESERGGDRGHNLGNQPVEVGVGWSLNVEVSSADVVDGFVVDHEGTVGVLQGGVGGQDRVVGLNNSGGDLRRGVDGELELALLSVVHTQSLEEERGESGSGTSTEGVEDEESLETGALVCQFPDPVQAEIYDLLLTV